MKKIEINFVSNCRDADDFGIVLLPTVIIDREKYGVNFAVCWLCWTAVLKIKL